MKKITTLVLFIPHLIFSQQGKWNYAGEGKRNVNKQDHENRQVISARDSLTLGSETNPGPRVASAGWSDKKGNIYVFGGGGIDDERHTGLFEDLWHYDAKNLEWEKLSGERKTHPIQSNKKEKPVTNSEVPAPRKGAASWSDKFGNLYLFGGSLGSFYQNVDDFWKFDIKTKSWSLLNGAETFNAKGRQLSNGKAVIDLPPARSGALTWTDSKGDFWMFGGSYFDSKLSKTLYLDDLWKYEVNKGTWSLMRGSLSPKEAQIGKKFTEEHESPGGRTNALGWYDKQNDRLWLYGGFGYNYDASYYGGLADMWMYDLKRNVWSSFYPKVQINAEFNTAILGFESPKANPGYRYSAMTWVDQEGKFWLYGGHHSTVNNAFKADKNIWKFDPESGNWTAVFSNYPPPVISGGSTFSDEEGNLWLFGGVMMDTNLNERPTNKLWKFTPETFN